MRTANLTEHSVENQLGVAAGLIFGMKKTVFNAKDYATVVNSSYATNH